MPAGRQSSAGIQADSFHLASGLQSVASQRFMLEASYPLPALRSDSNFLFGFRDLY